MSFHTGQTFIYGETPSASKMQFLWDNDYALADGSGIEDGVIGNRQLSLGVLVQVAENNESAVETGTTTIPNDDTIPTSTEGNEYITCSITPKSATNKLIIEANLLLSSSIAPAVMTVALFKDAGAAAIGGGMVTMSTNTLAPHMVKAKVPVIAGSTSAQTYRARAGAHSANTTTYNGTNSGRILGAIPKSSLTIMEYKAS